MPFGSPSCLPLIPSIFADRSERIRQVRQELDPNLPLDIPLEPAEDSDKVIIQEKIGEGSVSGPFTHLLWDQGTSLGLMGTQSARGLLLDHSACL